MFLQLFYALALQSPLFGLKGDPEVWYIDYIHSMKEMSYAVRCLKSNEDMILALAGQFKQLPHEPEKFRRLKGIRTHDLCDAGAVL